jgi:hypothetical protein
LKLKGIEEPIVKFKQRSKSMEGYSAVTSKVQSSGCDQLRHTQLVSSSDQGKSVPGKVKLWGRQHFEIMGPSRK